MAKRRKLRVGDIFTIPLDADRVGYGQIVDTWGGSGGHFYFAVFAEAYTRDVAPPIDDVVAGDIALLALSMDALLHHGHWEVVGHREVDAGLLPWPAFKEAVSPDEFHVVDHTGQRRRPATVQETDELPFRSVVSPIVLERALQAIHGLGEWDPQDDKLRPPVASRTEATAFGHGG